jgi:hypothetical protein
MPNDNDKCKGCSAFQDGKCTQSEMAYSGMRYHLGEVITAAVAVADWESLEEQPPVAANAIVPLLELLGMLGGSQQEAQEAVNAGRDVIQQMRSLRTLPSGSNQCLN